VKCNIIKRGTKYTGMKTRGNCAIGAVVTFPVIPWKKPEHIVPNDTATTRSMIPITFQITNR